MKTSIKTLASDGYVNMPYPEELRVAVAEAVRAWEAFCALPEEVKSSLPYSNEADGVGYERKDGVGPNADIKENFDVTTAGRDWLEQNVEKQANPIVAAFLQKSIRVSEFVQSVAIRFASEVEDEYGVAGLAKEVEKGNGSFFTRFIHYFGNRQVGDEIASAHVDKSGFTLHLFESAPGFEILDLGGKEWRKVSFETDETLVIPSMQLQLRSSGKLKAVCHRVVATAETARYGRFSAVCFVQLTKTPKYNKAHHGRLQEKALGFNYSIAPEAFSGLFE